MGPTPLLAEAEEDALQGMALAQRSFQTAGPRAQGPATSGYEGQEIGLAPPRVSVWSPAPTVAPGTLTSQLLVSAHSRNPGPGTTSCQPALTTEGQTLLHKTFTRQTCIYSNPLPTIHSLCFGYSQK